MDRLMMTEWPYTASSRDALGCTSPLNTRFPWALEMSPGTYLAPQENSWLSGMYNPTHPYLPPILMPKYEVQNMKKKKIEAKARVISFQNLWHIFQSEIKSLR